MIPLSSAVAVAEGLAGIPGVLVRRGRFVGLSVDGLALVDMGDSRFPSEFGADYIPQVNEPVQVLSVGSQHLMFPLGAKPKVGTVVSLAGAGSSTVPVDTATGRLSALYLGDSPAAGSRVLLEWTEEGPVVVGVLSTSPPPPAPPDPDPTPPKQVRSVIFRAVAAGSSDRDRPRWWTGNPYASNSTFGAWWYGSAIKDTIPANAEFVSLAMKITRVRDEGGAPRFALHTELNHNPGTLPAYSPYVEWDPPSGWHTPPNAADWFHSLKAGGGWAGVGLNQGGFNIFADLAQDGESGALSISWRS